MEENNLYVQVEYINADNNIRYGETDVYETFTADKSELYKRLQQEYGRCISRVYIDPADEGKPLAVGWVFQKRVKYDDCDETYLREVWVTLHKRPPTKVTTYHYAE